MLDAAMPGCVVPVEVFHTPGFFAAAQPGVLLTALARDAWVGEPQLPVGLPPHLYLPVLAAFTKALLTDYIEGRVKAGGILWDLLPGVYVSD